MKEQRGSYVQGIIGLPAVCIAAAWIALWFIWPTNGMRRMRYQSTGYRVAYVELDRTDQRGVYVGPDDFHRGSGLPGLRDELGTETLLVREARPPRFMETRRTNRVVRTVDQGPEPTADRAARELGAYRVPPLEKAVFAAPRKADPVFAAEISEGLTQQGFSVPDAQWRELKQGKKSWRVVVRVNVGKTGRAEHVFLETGCEDARINGMVIRVVQRGRARPGAECSGRVVVSFRVL
jgi:hypothetical protein